MCLFPLKLYGETRTHTLASKIRFNISVGHRRSSDLLAVATISTHLSSLNGKRRSCENMIGESFRFICLVVILAHGSQLHPSRRCLVSGVGCTWRTIPRKDDQTAEHEASGGLIGMNTKGQVRSVSVDEQTIIPYILTTFNNTELAFKTASRTNLPGHDDLYIRQYQRVFQSGRFMEAAQFPKSRSSSLPVRWQMRRGTLLDELVRDDGEEGFHGFWAQGVCFRAWMVEIGAHHWTSRREEYLRMFARRSIRS